jgi:hypothetical protein
LTRRAQSSWADPEAIAIFAPDSLCPAELNGVPLARVMLPCGATLDALAGSDAIDPALSALEPGLRRSAGAVEPDGRVWVFEPTNHFGGRAQHSRKAGSNPVMAPAPQRYARCGRRPGFSSGSGRASATSDVAPPRSTIFLLSVSLARWSRWDGRLRRCGSYL